MKYILENSVPIIVAALISFVISTNSDTSSSKVEIQYLKENINDIKADIKEIKKYLIESKALHK